MDTCNRYFFLLFLLITIDFLFHIMKDIYIPISMQKEVTVQNIYKFGWESLNPNVIAVYPFISEI